MQSFEGRAVVVTGGSRGIGLGIAHAFARAGARVLIVGRDPDRAAAAADSLTSATGTSVAHLAADLRSAAGCRQMAARAADELGGVDVLCANAGIYPERLLVDMTEDDFDTVLDTNLRSTVFAVQACIPALAHSRHGRVVLISSITGPITGSPGWSHYGASKAAQLGFMRSAALELAPAGTTVNAVAPGSIATESYRELPEHQQSEIRAAIPLGRMGSVEDVAAACLFLAGDAAGFVTGQVLVVDGGQVLPEVSSGG